jgi:hypothetical protein
MKQYRITSEHFVTQGETGDADAVMDAHDLAEIKKLAGLGAGLLEDYSPSNTIETPMDNSSRMSPVGSNISATGMEKRKLEKENHIKAGSPEWFRLWFSKPYLTGEKPIGDAPAPVHKKTND